MKYLGLTGGLGSGKSVVAKLLEVYGVPVYDSDSRSKELCVMDRALIQGLVDLYGSEVYHPDGRLNRQWMSGKMFADTNLLAATNALIHPAVGRDFETWAKQQGTSWVAQESAILFEARLEDRYHSIVTVVAPESIRIQRVCLRSGLTEAEVVARMNRQLTDEARCSKSDFVLVNDGLRPLIPQVAELLATLL